MLTSSTIPLLSKKGCEKLVNTRTIIAMVGLPGTAKTFLSRKMCNYLNWIGIRTKTFNVGQYRRLMACRRKTIGNERSISSPEAHHHQQHEEHDVAGLRRGSCFQVNEYRPELPAGVSESGDFMFDSANRDQIEQMIDACLDRALDDMCIWLHGPQQTPPSKQPPQPHQQNSPDDSQEKPDSKTDDGGGDPRLPSGSVEAGEVAILDATNSRRSRRAKIKKLADEHGFKLFFVEIVCDRPQFCKDPTSALAFGGHSFDDMQIRVNYFKDDYETLCPKHDASFIKVINIGQKFVVNKLQGRVPSRVVYYLMNLKVLPNPVVYIVRHGESHFNTQYRIGGDSQLTNRGKMFANRLAKYFYEHASSHTVVFTSTYRRTIQTAAGIDAHKQHWGALDEISAGAYDGLTYYEIASKYPDEFLRRDNDKFYYRYPQGESYQDLVARLEPVILAIERMESVLVICHQAVARCLIGYFRGITPELTPYIAVPLHNVVRISPGSYGVTYEEIALGVDCVDTHRLQPNNLNASRTIDEALSTMSHNFRSGSSSKSTQINQQPPTKTDVDDDDGDDQQTNNQWNHPKTPPAS